ncbi:MAG: TMEM165/GDT1 family protein [Pseudonocardiales bacterium]|nr:TMEM165/GDT1 family protein [Pseudonocardiales bacterium]
MGSGALFAAVFLACLVEAVEALTIVLAAGAGRDWRSAITGASTALAVLALIVAALGPALTAVPLGALRLVVGGLLLIFGLQWLRKAILRAGGLKARHDETAVYRTELAAAQAAPPGNRGIIADWYSFILSFKGVLLEGLEVAFIALTFGANQRNIPLAAAAAVAAVIIVTVTGVAVREPLARVPENTMKFAVGVMLTSFGVYWGAEGAGASWPGGDTALLVVVPAVALFALALVVALRLITSSLRASATAQAGRP